MGFFNKILEKLGLKKGEPESAPAKIVPSERPADALAAGEAARKRKEAEKANPAAAAHPAGTMPAAAGTPAAMSEVDVVAKLEKLAAENPAKLNWKVSIVDLLKLLDLDSSGAARKELAEELGCPADQMSDSARMNTWLHKTVLKKIAENGGNIPQSLLD